ncbi:hypothetical protein C8Q74DRAFT_751147 [Fomes fomentarius]|nr:hypothetical protein C8Q74DRAFT_751147 [Fomes fomentarius]
MTLVFLSSPFLVVVRHSRSVLYGFRFSPRRTIIACFLYKDNRSVLQSLNSCASSCREKKSDELTGWLATYNVCACFERSGVPLQPLLENVNCDFEEVLDNLRLRRLCLLQQRISPGLSQTVFGADLTSILGSVQSVARRRVLSSMTNCIPASCDGSV